MSSHKEVTRRRGAEICYLVLLAQLLLHIVLLRIYFRAVGQPGDVGSNYLAFWIIVVVPATALLALATRYAYRYWIGVNAQRQRAFFVLFGLIDVALLWLSFQVYTERFQG